MSRTTLCLITAAVLAALSLGMMFVRHQVLGDEVKAPLRPGTWKVTLAIQGRSDGDAKLLSLTPLHFGRQQIVREEYQSAELFDKPPDARHPQRRQVLWSQRAGVPKGPFRARYVFHCRAGVSNPTPAMMKVTKTLYAAPRPGEYLDLDIHPGPEQESLTALARRLTAESEQRAEQAEVLFRFVDREIINEPRINGQVISAVECLDHASGDSCGKSRLLTALLRGRGIPARLVTGLTLAKGHEQVAHTWVEAWIHEHWLPMCPFYHHYGRVPATYLVFGFGDRPLVRGRHISDLDYAFLVERTGSDELSAAGETSALRRTLRALSLYMLPPTEQRLVEFLLLLPAAALIVCVYRNVIGLSCFGTFAPALVGLAFRDLHSLPGILVFVSIVLVGWIMRRVLDYYHLLQVPRSAFLLSCVVAILIIAIVGANFHELPATKYISLFPIVILSGMVERFWTLETEDSTTASFKTLLGTMTIAGSIALVLSIREFIDHMFRFPETLGLIMAGQLLLGRYTGYRLLELFRFRDILRQSNEYEATWMIRGEP